MFEKYIMNYAKRSLMLRLNLLSAQCHNLNSHRYEYRLKNVINVNNTINRFCSSNNKRAKINDMNNRTAYYATALAVAIFGLSYASVPLYKVFCQMTGFGGTTQVANENKSKHIKPVDGAKIIKIYFMASVHSEIPWTFKPTQKEVHVIPGETALAFYTVKNTANHPITGVATYNVHPPKAGLYFNKIQCFCFEEQRLSGQEEIDMPVFFFIDPDILKDPSMENVTNITLSYTFFKTGDEIAEEIPEEISDSNKVESTSI